MSMLHLELSEGSSVHKIPLYTVKDGKGEGGSDNSSHHDNVGERNGAVVGGL